MDLSGTQRKRGGRVAKTANTIENPLSHNEFIDNSAVAISPTLEQPDSTPVSECRRSSRKKIIKFDVRDLLNKNRKTHKIQIEARIDSNAPSSSKAIVGDSPAATNFKSSATSREDLLSKHKTFLEKSAIFRRYSISQEQKAPPPLPIPPLLSKSNESKDSSFCGTSSSQEFLSHALIKPKEPTSLIVAQIESNKPTSVNISKRKGHHKSSEIKSIAGKSGNFPVVQQKKRGRPAKVKAQTSGEKAASNITPEKAKNWKEYKACLAQQCSSSNDGKNISKINEQPILNSPQQRNPTYPLIRKQFYFNDSLQSEMSRSDDDGSFSGFQISKDDASCDSPILEKKILDDQIIESSEDIQFKSDIESIDNTITFKSRLNKKYVVGDNREKSFSEEHQAQQDIEISIARSCNLDISNNSSFDTDKLTKIINKSDGKVENKNETTESYVAESFVWDDMQVIEQIDSEISICGTKHQIISDEHGKEQKLSKDVIANKAEGISSSVQKIENKKTETFKYVDYSMLETEKPLIELESSITTSSETSTAIQIKDSVTEIGKTKNSEISINMAAESSKTRSDEEESSINAPIEQTTLPQSSPPSYENKSFSRTSSLSESENASDRSIYSSEPFSSTSSSSSRSYKSRGMVKVSIKRLSLPKSPSTSSQTSTSEELNNANIGKRKPPIAKRPKRIKKKLNDPSNTDNISANMGDCPPKIPIEDKKFDGIGILAKKLSTKEQSEVFATHCKESTINATSSEMDTLKSDESNISSEIKSSGTNGSPNADSLARLQNNIKRKLARKGKDVDANKAKSDEVKTALAKETAEVQTLIENVENPQEKITQDDKNFMSEKGAASDQDDNFEDSKKEKCPRNSSTPTQQTKEGFGIYCTEEKSEILLVKDKTKIDEKNVTYDKVTNFDKDRNYIELNNEDDISKMNKVDNGTKAEANKSKKSFNPETTSCLGNEIETTTTDANMQQEMHSNFKHQDVNEQNLSSGYQVCRKESLHSKSFVLDTPNTSVYSDKSIEIVLQENITATSTDSIGSEVEDPNKTKSSKCNLTKKESSKSTEKTTCQLKEEIYLTVATSSETEKCKSNEDIFDIIEVNTEEEAAIQNSTGTEIEIDNQVKINVIDSIVTNEGSVVSQNLQIPDEKKADVDKKEKSLNTIEKEFEVKNPETYNIEISTSNINVQLEKADKNNEHQEKYCTSEMTNTKNSKNAQKETETELIESKFLSENMTKNFKKAKQVKEVVPSAISITRQKIVHQQEISLKKSAKKETFISDKSSKDNTAVKLLMETAEVKGNEVSAKKLEENNPQCHKSEIGSSNYISTKTIGSSNMNSLPKTKEDRPQISAVYPQRTTSEKTLDTTSSTSSTDVSTPVSAAGKVEDDTNKSSTSLTTTVEHLTAELSQDLNDPTSCKSHLPAKMYSKILLTESNLLQHSSEATLDEILLGTKTASETEKIVEDNSTSVTHRADTLEESKKQYVSGFAVTKRRGRKSRFKNVHAMEDSETDSNGKTTPIDEVIQRKLNPEINLSAEENKVDMKVSQKSSKMEIKKKLENVIVAEEPVAVQEDVATNLSTSQIKSVSIETNTLLDILRTVQSNTAAALKAYKSPITINKTDDENSVSSTKASEDSIKSHQEIPNSPIIFDFPSTSNKKHNLSPERSNSNSPLTLKKLTTSPSRSNSSSPLTLKKVTRRYERRSRRGEDAAHKTLEETFAEIAAQSSKAVLAAKEFEENSPEELDITSNSVIDEKEQINENLEYMEKISASSEINLQSGSDNKVNDILLNVAPDIDKPPTVSKEIGDDSVVDAIGGETAKAIPTKRGRKPKNRASECPIGTKEQDVNSAKTSEESMYESKDKEIDVDVDAVIKTTEKDDETQNDAKKVNESLETLLTENLPDCKEETFLPVTTYSKETETLALNLNRVEDMNENKSIKKFNTKRETKDKSADEDNSLVVAVACQEKSDKVRTPKQPIKKRDTSLHKSETKSVTKKEPKKIKNEEEDSTHLAKEDASIKNSAATLSLSKRGRKPKNQPADSPHSGSKKKTKKDGYATNDVEETNEEKVKLLDNVCESSLDTSLDEKLAKKCRQRKLKEAFEAALTDNKEKCLETSITDILDSTKSLNFGLEMFNNSPPPERAELVSKEDHNETIMPSCTTPVEAEDDPDPLKDIEKFIADGVNLLKKDYKLNENSVDDVIQATATKATEIVEDSVKTPNEDVKIIFNTFETPADTPISTPCVTPPPKSPTSLEPTTPDEKSGVRRSHRIKLITKTPKALVGRGLVRDRERFSIKDDVETKSHYTLDDHLTDLAEVEAKNAKFLKDMEERLSNFQVIKENEYLCERVISREARKMICDCFLTHDEEDRGELGCGEDCLNRLLMIECGLECNVKERCTNKRFQKLLCSPCRVFRTEKKGFGIMADIEILPGEFIMEYVGEVIDTEEFEKRRIMYSQEKNRHYYFMALRSDAIIDATIKGNISRFINHSCDPNAETQKWTVNGELRIGFFSRKSIMPGEEITFNYQYQRYGREAQRCYCESANCTGWIGQEPTSEEGEQIDDEDDETEDEEEDTRNLLAQDDDDDSDASVADPEEVQKRLEMAAAQAEAELAPLQLIQEKGKQVHSASDEGKTLQDLNKSDNEEDSKSKFKKLLSKMAEKVAAKQKQSKREQKLQRKKKSKELSSELANKLRFLEDPDIEDEVQFLKECGLKNQSDTLRLSRLMVRAKLVQTRLNLLEILRKGDLPCRRLFLDYHGMRLLHGWMSEDVGNMQIRLSLLQTLQTLPIANKTVLTDSKVMHVVRTWSGPSSNLSTNEDSSSSNSNSQDVPVQSSSTTFAENSEIAELQKLAQKLNTAWEGLPEIFRIPKKERIEQMKEHEREADRQYAANAEIQKNTTATDRYRRDRFGRGLNAPNNNSTTSNRFSRPNNANLHKTASTTTENLKNLSKAKRRELFAAKVARDEAEKRLAEERREFETKCRFFGLDPKKTRAQDMPFCVNPATGQWFSIERKPITTPPSYAHVQIPVKPKSTDPNDYQLPAVCSTLPPQWKYAITPQGKLYFYHIKHRLPQWEPPSSSQLQQCELEAKGEESESENTSTAGDDSSDDDDDVLIGMDAAQLKAYINRKVEMRRQKRYLRLVDERAISPRREEDRIYNQIEVRKYKENKEKIRKRKEDIRRKRAEALRQTSLNLCTLGSITDAMPNASKLNTESDEELGALPIQDYLLSSDEEVDIKAEVNSPLIDKIVEGDKIVDELDALTTKRQLKRPLPPHRDLGEISISSSASIPALMAITIAAKMEYKKRKLEKKEKRKPKEQDGKYRKNKEKFRCEIAGIIVHHLKPYLKETCTLGRIQSNEDFNHLARKLTHFVMIKELKYCESVGQTLVVTESVKSKSREFIKKYMAKYGDVYVKPTNDPDFKDIPFTL